MRSGVCNFASNNTYGNFRFRKKNKKLEGLLLICIKKKAMVEPNPRVYFHGISLCRIRIVGHTFTLSLPMMASIVSVGTLSVILNMILITCKIKSTMRRKAKDNMR